METALERLRKDIAQWTEHGELHITPIPGLSLFRRNEPSICVIAQGAKRVIRTIMETWHDKEHFQSPAHRKNSLIRIVNYCNWIKPHRSLENATPGETLCSYFFPESL